MSSIVQLRKDTLENWLKYDPVLADGEEVLVATDSAKPTEYNARKVGNGTAKFSALPMLGYDCLQETGNSTLQPMSQNATTEAISQGFDTSFKGRITSEITADTEKVPTNEAVGKALKQAADGFFIDHNHLLNFTTWVPLNPVYTASNLWDLLIIPIRTGCKKIEIQGCKIWNNTYTFYKDTELTKEALINVSSNDNIPQDAVWCVVNLMKSSNPDGYGKLKVLQYCEPATYEGFGNKIDDIYNLLKEDKSQEVQGETVNGKFYSRFEHDLTSHSGMMCNIYEVKPGEQYVLTGPYSKAGFGFNAVVWLDANKGSEKLEYALNGDESLPETYLTVPEGKYYLYVSSIIGADIVLTKVEYGDILPVNKKIQQLDKSISKLEARIDNIENVNETSSIKVHVFGLETACNAMLFYVRTHYNSQNDIIVDYYTNGNGVISPNRTFIGNKDLTDEQLRTSPYLVVTQTDSTAPLFGSDVYWHLFAQHGCPMPIISNTNGMTSDDVGSVWKDQLDREYTVGSVTASKITLLTPWTKQVDYNSRVWRATGTAITSLTHVNGGKTTTKIETVSGYSNEQLRPVMKSINRKWKIDGQEITKAGDYYGEEFQVSETQIGYDPSTIKQWFPINQEGAETMAIFTWSYNFKGCTCCVNTTFNIKKKIECDSYGACQQEFFFDNGEYKAMFLIPKVKPQNGVTLDKPFNSGSTSSPSRSFNRMEAYLHDVNDPYDRQIGYLYNPTTKDYKLGMAAGLSLISGDTVKEKRCENIPVGNENEHFRLGSFSPANKNKFYIAAVNTAPFKEDNYMFPVGYFKEINYYVSYFDPSENKGQVYWYKDGNSYVIYMHCQEVAKNEAINLPDFMEGLGVELIEKTENAELLTQRITNGKLFVNWNSTDGNYIVVKTV